MFIFSQRFLLTKLVSCKLNIEDGIMILTEEDEKLYGHTGERIVNLSSLFDNQNELYIYSGKSIDPLGIFKDAANA